MAACVRLFFSRFVLVLALVCAFALPVFAAPVDGGRDVDSLPDNQSSFVSPSDGPADSSDSVDGLLVDVYDSPALLIVGGDSDAGCWFFASAAFTGGRSVRWYFDKSYSSGSLILDNSGYLWNNTQNTVYLYSPDYPDYTVYAPRFGYFQYRINNKSWADASIAPDASVSSSLVLSDSQYRTSDASPVIVFLLSALTLFGLVALLRRAAHG